MTIEEAKKKAESVISNDEYIYSIIDFKQYYVINTKPNKPSLKFIVEDKIALDKNTGKWIAFNPLNVDMTGFEEARKNEVLF